MKTNGLQDVGVPEGPDSGAILAGGVSGAAAGASIGGPWGAAAGAVIGVAGGIIGNAKKKKAVKAAEEYNSRMKLQRAYAGTDPTEFQSEQIYPNGTQGIVTKVKEVLPSWANPKNWGVEDYSSAKSFNKAFEKAKKDGKGEFMWKDKRYNTKSNLSKKEQLKKYGITDDQRLPSSVVRKNLANNLDPVGYGDVLPRVTDALLGRKSESRQTTDPRRVDASKMYFGQPQENDTFGISDYRPTKSKDQKAQYYKLNNIPNAEELINRPDGTYQDDNQVMGQYTLSHGQDDKGKYVSYYDKWDLTPVAEEEYKNLRKKYNFLPEDQSMGIGKPYEIYDRIYYDEQEITDDFGTTVSRVPKKTNGANYMEGTKQVEVERDELIFQRNKLGEYKLKADFKGGKSHAQGGEDYVAQEGDVIFPGKMRNKVLDAFNKRNFKALETIRQRLPKDTPDGTASTGLDKTKYSMFKQPSGNPNDPSLSSGGPNVNSILGAAGVANNFIQALQPVEKVDRHMVNPLPIQYEDRSDPLRKQSRSVAAVDASNARNLSAGNAGNLRANLAQAKVADFNRQEGINNQEQVRADQVRNLNTQQDNQAQAQNVQLAGYYDQLQSANNAARGAYRDTAMEGLSQLAQTSEQKKYMQSQDAKRMEMDKAALDAYNQVFPRYQWDPKTGKVIFK